MEYLLIFIEAIFVNNIILSQFLGICPFLGVSKRSPQPWVWARPSLSYSHSPRW